MNELLLQEIYKELKALRQDVEEIKKGLRPVKEPEKKPEPVNDIITPAPIAPVIDENSKWSHIKIDGYPLTLEQSNILDLVASGKNLKIEAFAGSGKTTTLRAIATAFPKKKFLYLAFNKSVQLDAEQSFPQNVSSKTAHSLAYRWLTSEWGSRDVISAKLKGRFNNREFVSKYKIESKFKSVSSQQLAFLAHMAMRNYCFSGAVDMMPNHADSKELRGIAKNAKIDPEALQENVLEVAKLIWTEGTDPKKPLVMSHDMYLKMWSLAKPKIKEAILFDEAQDANPVILSVVESQKGQKIYVGDRHQQIYSWRGAISAFERVKTEHTASLTECFRFGEVIATPANKLIGNLGEKKSLKGVSQIPGTLTVDYQRPYTKIFRTNAALLSEAIKLSKECSLGVVGGIDSAISEIENAYALYKGDTSKSGEFAVYKTWDTLVDASEFDRSIKSVVKFINNYSKNLPSTLKRLKRMVVDELDSDIVLSTAHKAKGKEWDQVIVADDFPLEKGKKKADEEEQRLAYVAITRAKKTLEVPSNIDSYLK